MTKNIKDYNTKNISWLKMKMEEFLEFLDEFDDDDEVDFAQNTYWVGPNFISFGSLGFVDMDKPVDKKDEDDEDFEDSIKDSKQTLELGLKAEKDTIAQYSEFMKMVGDPDNPESKLWAHLIKDEEEHVRELEAALKGEWDKAIEDAVKDDEEVIISVKDPEQVEEEQEKIITFIDRINDVLQDGGVPLNSYSISEEDPYYYVDFGKDRAGAENAYELLTESLFKCDLIEDEEVMFNYVRVLRR